jgi:flagellar hook protein FlgE
MMRTGVSGMNAQANRLSAVADNIANASTIGYKRAETQFSSLVLPSSGGQYNSGSVLTSVRYGISDQGGIRSTSSTTDLAIDGNGYFLVQGADGATYLTRAGSFVPDKDGNLVNTAGYYLLGSADGSVAPDLNGLSIVNVNAPDLTAIGSTAGTFTVNLPTTDTPPATAGDYNHKTSLISYNNAGEAVKLDVYFTKNADDTWSVSVKNAADNVEIGTGTLTFDPVTGAVVSGGNVSVDLTGYNGGTLDLNLGAVIAAKCRCGRGWFGCRDLRKRLATGALPFAAGNRGQPRPHDGGKRQRVFAKRCIGCGHCRLSAERWYGQDHVRLA